MSSQHLKVAELDMNLVHVQSMVRYVSWYEYSYHMGPPPDLYHDGLEGRNGRGRK